MRIQHNIMAMNAYRNYTNNTRALSKNLEKLSSGYKINRAGDDAAGLAISEKMRAQITGLEAAQKNVKDGVSLVNTAEGAMQEVHDMLNRMVYLATQSANGTYDNEVDRKNLQQEVDQLKEEINRIADSANFNGIKLLDGVSGSGKLTKLPVEFDTVSTTAGITLDKVQDGAGSQGQFTIDITNKFSYGDTIDITGTLTGITGIDTANNDSTLQLTMAQSGADLTFDGDTAEAQAQSIANALTGKIGGYYDVKADGSKVIITAKAEGTENADGSKIGTIDSITASNSGNATITAATGTAAANGTAGDKYIGALEVLGGKTGGQSGNIAEGDILTFNFKDANGNALTAKITATKEMANERAEVATQAIVDALKEATFEDNKNTTGIDESQIKVSDLFTLTANKEETVAAGTTANGTIRVEAVDAAIIAGGNSAVSVEINRNGSKTLVNATQGQAAAAATGSPAAQVWTHTARPTNNLTAGDKVKVTGTLADGRTFEAVLEAGKDFEIDKDTTSATSAIDNTMTNLANALKKADVKVTTKTADGKEGATMTGTDLFGDKGEFTATATSGVLSITSNKKGTAATRAASNITAVTVEPIDAAKATLNKNLATAQGAAESSFTFDGELSYGAAVTVGDHTYEIVADARDTVNRNNTAVVVSDPSDSAAVAKAMAEAINKNEKDQGTGYTADYNGSTVTVSSDKIGSAQKALAVSMPYGDSVTTASFAFDPAVVKNGSTLTFNDQKYEFVTKGSKASEGAVAIEVADFGKATSKDLGDAFLAVLNNGTGTIAEDGTITLRSNEVDGKIADPVLRFENYMTLQIGDTSDSYNQLKVTLADLHTKALGIDGVNIASPEGAAAAIDVVKDAINYVSSVRGTLGAISNRLDHTANNLSVMTENIQDAESSIRDTDIADEMMAYTKNNILVQSAQAMLAQANQVPQGVLQLLQ